MAKRSTNPIHDLMKRYQAYSDESVCVRPIQSRQLYYRQGQWQEARADFERAVSSPYLYSPEREQAQAYLTKLRDKERKRVRPTKTVHHSILCLACRTSQWAYRAVKSVDPRGCPILPSVPISGIIGPTSRRFRKGPHAKRQLSDRYAEVNPRSSKFVDSLGL